MPTYRCSTAVGRLCEEARAQLAEAITVAHHEVTGAPAYFAQVVFAEVEAGHVFIGGAPLSHDHIFVQGWIRAGRPREKKLALIRRLAADVARVAKTSQRSVWVYLSELPPEQMVEFGEVLPEDGQELAWRDRLDPELRSWLETL